MFALDVNLAIQLLSSFDGEVIFPKTESKEEILMKLQIMGAVKLFQMEFMFIREIVKRKAKLFLQKLEL